MKTNTLVKCVLMLAAVVVLGMMVKKYNERSVEVVDVDTSENFYQDDVVGADGSDNEKPGNIEYPTKEQASQCFPRDRLTADDLLPKDAANSKFAKVNPAGQGDVDGENYLTAGNKIGVNSVGTSLRNSNIGLRSEPPNPQIKVSPWMQTTIGPDLNRRALE
jgi:hypothetical protein